MLNRLGRGLIFIAGSVVGGLALAFLIVAARPELIRGTGGGTRTEPTSTAVTTAGPAQVTYAAAVQRAAPSVVNVYAARLVTERVAPSLGELFGDYMPRYRQRIERSLGSGVIVDESGHIVTNHHVIANADSIRVQLADGRVVRGWIGIVPEDLSDEQAQQLGFAQSGVIIGNLYVNSPAQQAGLQPGDLLTGIDGTPPHSAQDARAHRESRAGQQRGAAWDACWTRLEVRAQVGERPRSG